MKTRKKKANTRPHVISVRLSDAELEQLEKLAAESNCSMTEILRRGLKGMIGYCEMAKVVG